MPVWIDDSVSSQMRRDPGHVGKDSEAQSQLETLKFLWSKFRFGCVGCLGVWVILILLGALISVFEHVTGTDEESVQRKARTAEVAKERLAQETKEAAIRTFALKESPVLWQTIGDLKASIITQNEKLAKLRKTFIDLNMDPAKDPDYKDMVAERDAMVKKLAAVQEKLNQAYLASAKYEATQGHAEKQTFEQKANEEGLSEAGQTKQRYDEMRKNK